MKWIFWIQYFDIKKYMQNMFLKLCVLHQHPMAMQQLLWPAQEKGLWQKQSKLVGILTMDHLIGLTAIWTFPIYLLYKMNTVMFDYLRMNHHLTNKLNTIQRNLSHQINSTCLFNGLSLFNWENSLRLLWDQIENRLFLIEPQAIRTWKLKMLFKL